MMSRRVALPIAHRKVHLKVDIQTKQREFDDYLYTRLQEIVEESESPELAAYRIALVISFGEKNVDSTRLEMYLSRVDVPYHIMKQALNYFAGADLLSFEGYDPEHPSFKRGQADKRFGTEMFEKSKNRIEAFQSEFWSDTHE